MIGNKISVDIQTFADLLYHKSLRGIIDEVFIMICESGLGDSDVILDINIEENNIIISHSRVRGIGYTKKNKQTFTNFIMDNHEIILDKVPPCDPKRDTPVKIISSVLDDYMCIEDDSLAEQIIDALDTAGYLAKYTRNDCVAR